MLDTHDGADSIYSMQSTSHLSSMSTMSASAKAKKSSMQSSLKNLASQIVAYHFCQADNAPTCLVPEFVHSVAAQMSQSPQLTPYYQVEIGAPISICVGRQTQGQTNTTMFLFRCWCQILKCSSAFRWPAVWPIQGAP